MDKAIYYTMIGYYLNALLADGQHIEISETKDRIRDGSLFRWLEEKFGEEIDVSFYNEAQSKIVLDRFSGFADNTDEDRKLVATKNGLALLIAYCFEALQEMGPR